MATSSARSANTVSFSAICINSSRSQSGARSGAKPVRVVESPGSVALKTAPAISPPPRRHLDHLVGERLALLLEAQSGEFFLCLRTPCDLRRRGPGGLRGRAAL